MVASSNTKPMGAVVILKSGFPPQFNRVALGGSDLPERK